MAQVNKFLIIVVVALTSCGPTHYLRKANKAIKKAEQLGAVWASDTVYRTIEVPVPEVRVDSVFVTEPADTVVMERERLRVQIIRKFDTLRVEAECQPDTIHVEVPVTVEKEIKCPPPYWTWWKAVGLAVIFLVVGYALRGIRW